MGEILEHEIIHNYNFYLSFSDLAKLDVCKGGSCQNLTEEEFKNVLWNNGVNTKRPYQIVFDEHRCLEGDTQKTNRVLGFMRSDDEWKEKFGSHIEVVLQTLKTEIKYRGCEDML